jgi:hypothetical protein
MTGPSHPLPQQLLELPLGGSTAPLAHSQPRKHNHRLKSLCSQSPAKTTSIEVVGVVRSKLTLSVCMVVALPPLASCTALHSLEMGHHEGVDVAAALASRHPMLYHALRMPRAQYHRSFGSVSPVKARPCLYPRGMPVFTGNTFDCFDASVPFTTAVVSLCMSCSSSFCCLEFD